MKNRENNNYGAVITLAYSYRYGLIVIAGVIIALFRTHLGFCIAMCGLFFMMSAYTLIGYRCRFRHIYCAMQNAHLQKMTPDNVRWDEIRKSDIYGSALLYAAIGAIMLYFTVRKYM